MNGKDLLTAFGNINPQYYEEAEKDTLSSGPARRTLRKPLLVAAIVALSLLLVGCAVVYALRLQDMSIGQETYTQTFDEQGRYLDEPVEKTRDILTMYGHSGDAIQQALTEWYDFLNTYDPEGKFSTNDPDIEEIPDQYEYIYSCYTQDMVDKVNEIAKKYGLKLLETRVPFQSYQSQIFLRETGIDSLIRPEAEASTSAMAGMLYLPENFNMHFDLKVEGMTSVYADYAYTRRDYFPRDISGGGLDLSDYVQWDHTAPDGRQLLLARSSKGHGIIIVQTETAMINISISGNFSGSSYPQEDEIISREDLGRIADVFDYSIKPQTVDLTAVENALAEAEAAYQAEHTYEPETFGSFADVLKSRYGTPDETARYTFFDLTGDGTEELLLDSYGYGTIDQWYTVQNGEVQFFWGNDSYLCEGMILEKYTPDPERKDYAHHYYQKSDSETAWMDTDPESCGEFIEVLLLTDGKWTTAPELYSQQEREITAEEAQAIMDKYTRIQLDWKPVMDYPISETQTLRSHLEEKDVRVSQEELLEIYRSYLANMKSMHYSHYRILDINADGVDDLLLKGEDDAFIGKTDFYWMALTYRYGIIEGIASDFYLCENGVLEHTDTRHTGGIGVEIDGHEFFRYNGLEKETLDLVTYNKATASWSTDWWDEKSISEAEANAIIAQYPRIDQGMRPISELLN